MFKVQVHSLNTISTYSACMGTIIKCCNLHIILGYNKKRMKSVYLLEIKTHRDKKKKHPTISQCFSNMFIYCNQMKILKHTIVVYWILFYQFEFSTKCSII